MNDMNKSAVPVFSVAPLEEKIKTRCFGTVTIHDIGSDRIEALLVSHAEDESNLALLRELLCEAAEGEHGERFTMELLRKLPARAIQDRNTLIVAAGRVNGIGRQEVENE